MEISIPSLAFTENQGVIMWCVRDHPPHSREPLASCHVLKKGGMPRLFTAPFFPLGGFVLVHLSSLLIHALLFWLNDDGGAILGERLTKYAVGFPTIPILIGLCCQKNPSQGNAFLSPPPSIPMSTFLLLRFTCKRTAFALYKVLCFY